MTSIDDLHRVAAHWPSPSVSQIRVLLAEDDPALRSRFTALLRHAKGVSSVFETVDGVDAVQVGRRLRPEVAVLDLNMPRLSGVEAAARLAAEQPSMRIALHSADFERLQRLARGLSLALFDKLEPERLVQWVERQARAWCSRSYQAVSSLAPLEGKRDLRCQLCGYGIVSPKPPDRCPMCQTFAVWAPARSRR
jgi:DNA-binding NarL/FixJ family response regulator